MLALRLTGIVMGLQSVLRKSLRLLRLAMPGHRSLRLPGKPSRPLFVVCSVPHSLQRSALQRSAHCWWAIPLLAIPFIVAQAPIASAQSTKFALACIGTETGYAVNFAYRWGSSGEWTSATVAPGKWLKLTWNYKFAGENKSPALNVRYDDNTTGVTNIVRTPLKAYAATHSDCEDQGKTFNFYQRGTELYISEED
jgi:hypothetical protein